MKWPSYFYIGRYWSYAHRWAFFFMYEQGSLWSRFELALFRWQIYLWRVHDKPLMKSFRMEIDSHKVHIVRPKFNIRIKFEDAK